MKLIVDSGSTKTDWIAIDNDGQKLFETQTLGLNPQVLTEHILEERVINNYEIYQSRKKVSELFFYGAGCGTKPPKDLISSISLEVNSFSESFLIHSLGISTLSKISSKVSFSIP